MYSLRQICKAHPRLVSRCFFYDGKVYAYAKDPIAGRRDRCHLVIANSEPIKICSEHVKQPLEAFLECGLINVDIKDLQTQSSGQGNLTTFYLNDSSQVIYYKIHLFLSGMQIVHIS